MFLNFGRPPSFEESSRHFGGRPNPLTLRVRVFSVLDPLGRFTSLLPPSAGAFWGNFGRLLKFQSFFGNFGRPPSFEEPRETSEGSQISPKQHSVWVGAQNAPKQRFCLCAPRKRIQASRSLEALQKAPKFPPNNTRFGLVPKISPNNGFAFAPP